MLNGMFNIRILYIVDCYLLTVNKVTFDGFTSISQLF